MAFLAILASYVVDAQRGRKTAEAGPARYLAKLFGSGDTAADYGAAGPLAVLLTLAATRR